MNRKPAKVEEPAGTYAAKAPKPATPAPVPTKQPAAAVRFLDDAKGRRLTDRIFSERKELLRKLAQ